MIIRGGFNVYPREIEETMLTHPAVSLAAVIGVPDDENGEEIKAFVIKNAGDATTPDELVGLVRRADGRLQVPADRRVRRDAAHDGHRQDPEARTTARLRFEWRSREGWDSVGGPPRGMRTRGALPGSTPGSSTTEHTSRSPRRRRGLLPFRARRPSQLRRAGPSSHQAHRSIGHRDRWLRPSVVARGEEREVLGVDRRAVPSRAEPPAVAAPGACRGGRAWPSPPRSS